MPYLRRINSTSVKTYVSRTVLLLRDDGTLKPLAIELSLPLPKGDQHGAVSKVYTPAQHAIEGSLWQLAKTYVAVNDSGVHQLISHCVVHPIHKLLHPHFRDTMYINAIARGILIDADGFDECSVFPEKYCMELTSLTYKDWNLVDQALHRDIKKRRVAVDDKDSPNDLRLVIKDYPYAVDGLEIWFAIEKWGHGDKKHDPWWPQMRTREDLIDSCTIIIWMASALHVAIDYGQYAYAGYHPNHPTITRRFMPEKGTPEYNKLKHSSDDVYLGQSDAPEWTSDGTPLAAFKELAKKLLEVEERIVQMINDKKNKNCIGPVNVPYTLLYPTSEAGITVKGIPNNVTI
ncbi:hypothetical protein Goshw_010462 [Gossypium schwendimanii]|uniref:Lipoxygenase domain-containing protein n=1 Tax=Gossypium schwendimanii TaxID=34291 RepID=A0A7J9MSP5_GOSSC|nr:hypothetical protein [Gossypium schwendimanii]